jgi:acetyl-CoA carboxylase carboxyl transferase subunit alpha
MGSILSSVESASRAMGAHEDYDAAAELLRQALSVRLAELDGLTPDQIVEHRYMKFRKTGNFFA